MQVTADSSEIAPEGEPAYYSREWLETFVTNTVDFGKTLDPEGQEIYLKANIKLVDDSTKIKPKDKKWVKKKLIEGLGQNES